MGEAKITTGDGSRAMLFVLGLAISRGDFGRRGAAGPVPLGTTKPAETAMVEQHCDQNVDFNVPLRGCAMLANRARRAPRSSLLGTERGAVYVVS